MTTGGECQIILKNINTTDFQNGHKIKIELAKSHKDASGDSEQCSVRMLNLRYGIIERELKAYCEQEFGPVRKLNMPRSSTGTSKGIAFVQFEEKETAIKALTKAQFQLVGRPVYVKTIENKREVKSMIPEG